MSPLTRARKVTSGIQILIGGHLVGAGLMLYTGNETMWDRLVMPVLCLLDPETGHRWAVKAARYHIVPKMKQPNSDILKTKVFGREFANPLGIAAGFDKHGEAVDGLLKIGFGFVEIGSVTPLPQEGNPKPRVFRLTEDKAVINRYGFNSDGHDAVYERLHNREQQKEGGPSDGGTLGINLGKNKTSPDAVGDYVAGVRRFGKLAGYLVINISSPNTPGLRAMQGQKQLQNLIDKVVAERDSLPEGERPPLLIKIAPDLTERDKVDIAAIVSHPECGVDGLVISNTTVGHPESLHSIHKAETGGLSGAPLRDKATTAIRDMYTLTHGRVPIIGVGGISSGEDALEKIKAGASLVQLYTAFSLQGPTLIPRIKRELATLLEKEGFATISAAVGADHISTGISSSSNGNNSNNNSNSSSSIS